MSDFGAAPRMDWTLQGKPFESASFKWGLPLLPHLHETFSRTQALPAFEVSLDRLLLQEKSSIDRSWARAMAQKTDVCLLSRLLNLGGEREITDAELKNIAHCVEEISPRWFAISVGFNAQRGHVLQNPLPLPKTQEMFEHLVERIRRLKFFCNREIALVNVASMFRYSFDSFSETEFLSKLVDATGCKIILDIPAFYVSLYHREQDFESELAKLPLDAVASVRIGALALSTHGIVDAECGRLSITHWGLLEDVLHALPANQHRAIFLKWFEPLVSGNDLVSEIISGQSALKRLGEV
jgi:uncharacterized protein (UPF0276 family)